MIQRQPWFQRIFPHGLEPQLMPGILERLRGTPARLAERVRGMPRELCTWHPAPGTWSIQENAGHLGDMEPLWIARLEESLAGKPTLQAADLSNRKTHEARHDERDLAELLESFRRQRQRFVQALEPLGEADVVRAALHPRLQVPMRVIDQAFFVAEHDDAHLARISELLRQRPG